MVTILSMVHKSMVTLSMVYVYKGALVNSVRLTQDGERGALQQPRAGQGGVGRRAADSVTRLVVARNDIQPGHRQAYFCRYLPKCECSYDFPIDLAPDGISIIAKLIGNFLRGLPRKKYIFDISVILLLRNETNIIILFYYSHDLFMSKFVFFVQ